MFDGNGVKKENGGGQFDVSKGKERRKAAGNSSSGGARMKGDFGDIRNIGNLRDEVKGKLHFWMRTPEVCRQFFKEAEKEGSFFGQCFPTEKEVSDIIAVEPDGQLSYVGFVGRMAWQCAGSLDNLTRVDYEKYVRGEADYYFHSEEK